MKLLLTALLILALAGCKTVEAPYVADTGTVGGMYGKVKSAGSFAWPIKGDIISYFGSKTDRVKNKGIDISAREGSSVRAAKSGRVVLCDEWLKGLGKTIILDHGNNFQTVYAYNSLIMVNLGDMVEQNSIIAKAGKTGRAKEPSLHFEIRKDGEPQNPFYYLAR